MLEQSSWSAGGPIWKSRRRTIHLANMRRGTFIGKCMEVQEAFSFAAPTEVLDAFKLYCGDLYGGMLARLDSPEATKLLSQWPKFFRSLLSGPSSEVGGCGHAYGHSGQQRPDPVCHRLERLDRNPEPGADQAVEPGARHDQR